MPYQAIATLPGGQTKTFPNRDESELLAEIVIPFVSAGTISSTWGEKSKKYQPIELRIYQTPKAWDKKKGALENQIKSKRNLFSKFEKIARERLGKEIHRVFLLPLSRAQRAALKINNVFTGNTRNVFKRFRTS